MGLIGSPPRMRGAASVLYDDGFKSRITPAYAGSRIRSCVSHMDSWDHPRVCGEQAASVELDTGSMGSPPRMRGAVSLQCHVMSRSRITPAYAGSSTGTTAKEASETDHPRVCGEQVRFFFFHF